MWVSSLAGCCSLAVLFMVSPLLAQTLPVVVKIDVEANSVAYTMAGGIGASWHAIDEPISTTYDPLFKLDEHGGSGWGGTPPAEDETGWQQIYRHAEWLGLDFIRVEIEQRMYEPEQKRFTWDNREMQILYRILDWCQRHKADVFFQQMWSNVDWNTFTEWRKNPTSRVHSGPLSMEDFAEGLATCIEHLVQKRGYTCIRWVCITNEPGYIWSWWAKPPDRALPLRPGLEAVRKALDRRGLKVPLSAPDWVGVPGLNPEKPERIDFHDLIGAYDFHSYFVNFDWHEGGGRIGAELKNLADWSRWAHSEGRPVFMSELGTMVFGLHQDNPAPTSYKAIMKDVEYVVRGIGAGADGFNRWSFINRGDLDGQWQLIDTWDRGAKKLLHVFPPHANSYFLFGLLSRFTAKHSMVLKCMVEGGRVGKHQRVFAAGLRSPAGNITVLVVNDADSEWQVRLNLGGLAQPCRLLRYQVTPKERDRTDVRIEPGAEFLVQKDGGALHDTVPAMSLAVYTTYQRKHDEPGVIAD